MRNGWNTVTLYLPHGICVVSRNQGVSHQLQGTDSFSGSKIIVNHEFMTNRLFSYLYAMALARKGEILFYFNHSIADTDMSLNILRRLRCRL